MSHHVVRNIHAPHFQVCLNPFKSSEETFIRKCKEFCPELLENFNIELLYVGSWSPRKVLFIKASLVLGQFRASFESEIRSMVKPDKYTVPQGIDREGLGAVSLNVIARLSFIQNLIGDVNSDLTSIKQGRFILPTKNRHVILFEFDRDGRLTPSVKPLADHEKVDPRELLAFEDDLFVTH